MVCGCKSDPREWRIGVMKCPLCGHRMSFHYPEDVRAFHDGPVPCRSNQVRLGEFFDRHSVSSSSSSSE